MAVSKRLRYEILRRDSNTCRYCGQSAPDVKLTVDHVVPTALGGSDDPSNLVAACKDCNAGKSASAPDAALVADVDAKAVRWGKAMQIAIDQRAAELAVDRVTAAWFNDVWNGWTRAGETMPRDPNWKNSVLRFMAGGLDREFLVDAIATAMGKERLPDRDRWRYFCGICWRELDRIREMTEGLLEQPEDGGDTRMPRGPGLDPNFDVLNLTDSFLAQLLWYTDAPGKVGPLAHQAYWAGMEAAYKAFRQGPVPPFENADEYASEEFDNATAYYFNEIGQMCRYHPIQVVVSDGQE